MDPVSETQKHQGSKKAASQPKGKPGFGKMSAQKQPFLCGPTPCSTVLGLDRQKNACFSVLHLVFPKLIFYHNHNKNHHQQKSSILVIIFTHKGFFGGSAVKNLPAMQEPQEMWVQSLDWKDPLEKEMATHSSILAWRIPWTEEPGEFQSMGLQRVRHNWSDLAHAHSNHINQSNPFLGLSFIRAGPKAGCSDVLSPDLGAAHSSLPSPSSWWSWCLLYTGCTDKMIMMSRSFEDVSCGTQRRQWHTTPVFLPGKSHGQRSLVGCSSWGLEESDTTEWLHFHFSPSCIGEGNGNPLQYSCLENPGDGRAWWAAIHGVAQSWTRLKRLSSSSSSLWD